MSRHRVPGDEEALRVGLKRLRLREAIELKILHRQFSGKPLPGMAALVTAAHSVAHRFPWIKRALSRIAWSPVSK